MLELWNNQLTSLSSKDSNNKLSIVEGVKGLKGIVIENFSAE